MSGMKVVLVRFGYLNDNKLRLQPWTTLLSSSISDMRGDFNLKIRNILEGTGAKLGGAIIKDALKLLPGGHFVVVGAEIIGTAVETTLEEMANRQLSCREEFRVALSASTVITKIAQV